MAPALAPAGSLIAGAAGAGHPARPGAPRPPEILPVARRVVLVALAAHPTLWPTAARQVARAAPPGWWRRPPFLPLPDREYLRFRFETQYGAALPEAGVLAADLVRYLAWVRTGGTERFPAAR